MFFCLNLFGANIDDAFKWRKPAVISTHRANYVGGMQPENRDKGLSQLKSLIRQIQKNWPEVIFLSSSQLGDLITKKLALDEIL